MGKRPGPGDRLPEGYTCRQTRAMACLKWTCRLHSAEHADRPKGNDAFGKSENDESMTLFQVVIEA